MILEEGRTLLFNKLVRYPAKPNELKYAEKFVVGLSPTSVPDTIIQNVQTPIMFSNSEIGENAKYQSFQLILSTDGPSRSLSIPPEVIEFTLESHDIKEKVCLVFNFFF